MKVSVHSYGIPEIHGLYQRLPKRPAKPAQAGQAKAPQKRWRKSALVHVYYWSGRPFALGNKLEATVTKRPL